MLLQPRLKLACVMPPCVIQNQDHLPTSVVMGQELLQETKKSLGRESIGLSGYQPSIGYTDGSEYCDTVPSRCMENDRIHILWRHPHGTSRTVLMEMTFILKPEITILSSSKAAEFFYMFAAPPGLPRQPTDAAFAGETLAGGTISGIAAPQD